MNIAKMQDLAHECCWEIMKYFIQHDKTLLIITGSERDIFDSKLTILFCIRKNDREVFKMEYVIQAECDLPNFELLMEVMKNHYLPNIN